jgi:hypothetical protein
MPHHLSSATDDDRVLSLRTRRRYQPADGSNKTLPPPADLDRYERSTEPDDFRHRMTVNAVAFVFVVGLVIAGFWLADTITTLRKTQDCVLAGKRGCGPVETTTPGR